MTHGAHWLPHTDSVCVMTNGRITECGKYEDLMQRGGNFSVFIKTFLNEESYTDSDDQGAQAVSYTWCLQSFILYNNIEKASWLPR